MLCAGEVWLDTASGADRPSEGPASAVRSLALVGILYLLRKHHCMVPEANLRQGRIFLSGFLGFPRQGLSTDNLILAVLVVLHAYATNMLVVSLPEVELT